MSLARNRLEEISLEMANIIEKAGTDYIEKWPILTKGIFGLFGAHSQQVEAKSFIYEAKKYKALTKINLNNTLDFLLIIHRNYLAVKEDALKKEVEKVFNEEFNNKIYLELYNEGLLTDEVFKSLTMTHIGLSIAFNDETPSFADILNFAIESNKKLNVSFS